MVSDHYMYHYQIKNDQVKANIFPNISVIRTGDKTPIVYLPYDSYIRKFTDKFIEYIEFL